jgi:hypothetical protein
VTRIAVLNQSTAVTDAEVATVVDAVQVQVTRDFAPLYGGATAEMFVGPPTRIRDWTVYVQDNSTIPGALGYHDLNSAETPIMYVFAKTSRDNNVAWSGVLSHEILEALADPYIQLCAQISPSQVLGYEVADPVEQATYNISGVPVSDFVTRAWFEPNRTVGAKYDFLAKLSAPRSLLPGGSYMSVGTAIINQIVWTQRFASGEVKQGGDPDDGGWRVAPRRQS